jgi:hypothetical protein
MDEYWKMGLTLDYYSISFRRMRRERDGKRKVVFGIKEVGVTGEYLIKPFRLRTSNRKLKEEQWKRLS